VLSVIEAVKTNGPAVADVDQARRLLAGTRVDDIKTNAYWLRNLAARDQAGEDPMGLLSPYDEMIRNLNPALIKQAALQYFDTKNFAKFVLLPEAAKSAH
jgi:zinc protease